MNWFNTLIARIKSWFKKAEVKYEEVKVDLEEKMDDAKSDLEEKLKENKEEVVAEEKVDVAETRLEKAIEDTGLDSTKTAAAQVDLAVAEEHVRVVKEQKRRGPAKKTAPRIAPVVNRAPQKGSKKTK